MRYKVIKKQPYSTNCFICGKENPGGLQADFYELDTGEIACVFCAKQGHEGHPGILHGGVICAILDETAGRSMTAREPKTSAYTVDLQIQFLKTVPSGQILTAIARVDEIKEKVYIASGEIYLTNGQIAAKCVGTYYRIPPSKTHESSTYHEALMQDTVFTEIEIPDYDPKEEDK